MAETILSVKNLTKTYPNGIQALKNINFEVRQGEFLVVIGLSGSGKTTLLKCINRLLDPTSGQIIFKQNVDVAALTTADQIQNLRTKIGMIFQQFNLIPRHTVLLNVLMGRLSSTSNWKSLFRIFSHQDKADALKYLHLVGIADKAQVRADQLSGGQQQRVAIARALLQNPEVLLADEPVASLDPATCHVVMDYLKKVNQELGITVVCNLHFLSLVRLYATRVLALKDGVIVFEGLPSDINEKWFEEIYGVGAKEVHVN
jgi:phosphonate transport system ATP-binding protein